MTEEMIGDTFVCGDDVKAHIKAVQSFVDAGYDEIYINQIGPDQEGFFEFYAARVLPEVR